MRSYSSARLFYVTKGQGRITIAGLTSGYGPNNLIFIPANTMFGYEIGTMVFGQMLTIPNSMASDWPETTAHLRLRDVVAQKELQSQFDSIEKELKSTGQTHSRAAMYQLGLLSVFFERQLAAAPDQATAARAQTSAARLVAAYADLIERDFSKGFGVSHYAKMLGVTPTHLTRCCNQTCQKSALALLHNRVHFEACELLRETNLPINKIATQLGFRSAAYFARDFTTKSGACPTAFRKFGNAATTTQQIGNTRF